MYSLTTNRPPYVHVGCGCGRKFIIEEMYLNFDENQIICRFCTQNTIDDVFCPSCGERHSIRDSQSLDNKCSRCLYCPFCFNKVVLSKSTINDKKTYYFLCTSCKWNSVRIGIAEETPLDIMTKCSVSNDSRGDNLKNKVFLTLLNNLKANQDEIMNREKKEVRQKKKTNLVEENKGSSNLERVKYTHDMYAEDEKKRKEIRFHQMTMLEKPIPFQLLDGKIEPKVAEPPEELDLGKEFQIVEDNWKLRDLTNLEQRHKDVYNQHRKKSKLYPIPVSLLPFVTKQQKGTKKLLIRPNTSRAGADDKYFEVDQLAMKNFPTVTIKEMHAKNETTLDMYIRFTNPNMSNCGIRMIPLTPEQAEAYKPNLEFDMPEGFLKIDFHNDLIGREDIDTSVEMLKEFDVKEEDKAFIKDADMNFVLLKLPAKLKEGYLLSKNFARLGFNLEATFYRENFYTVESPIFITSSAKARKSQSKES
ncbi:unnamed protein product [Moneuplotes crassus]|uniref:Dynactin subunit 4 n=1 Tax=Euplotes crassus TaxID=5936 RepID=A0AAD1XCS1_EUPCR|nr:unnamed protein product [Moneuplotes crassus]